MGRPRKEIPKRICGVNISPNDAAPMKYKRQNTDGTYSIDTDTIKAVIDDYIDNNTVISISGLLMALGIRTLQTLALWDKGFTSDDMMHKDDVIANQALSEAVSRGKLAVAKYYEEREAKYTVQKDIIALQSLGIYNKNSVDVAISTSSGGLGSLKQYAK